MTLLTTLSNSPPDFWTGCFSKVMPTVAYSVTYTNGVDYDIDPEGVSPGLLAEDCLAYLVNSRHSGMGRTSGGANQDPYEHGVWLTGDVVNTITVNRLGISSAVDCRVTIGIVAVVDPNSDSRFWVRQRGPLTFGNSDFTKSAAVSGVEDATRVWVCITGQQTSNTSRPQSHQGYFTADYSGGNVELARGQTGLGAVGSYSVVEWGSDWRPVQRLAFTSGDIGSDSGSHDTWSFASPTVTNVAPITNLGGSVLIDISRAFPDCQYRINHTSSQGNNDLGEVIELTGVDELTSRTNTTTDSGFKNHVVWISEWDGHPDATPPIAEHISHFREGGVDGTPEGTEEGVTTTTITEVVSESNTSILGSTVSSDGTGAGSPRGRVDFCLASSTTVDETRSETSRSERRAYTVFQWPVGAMVFANRRAEISSAGSAAALLGVARSERSEVASAGSAAASLGVAGSERSELRQAGSAGSAIHSL